MSIFYGSMNHSYSGRKIKKPARGRNKYVRAIRGADMPTYSNYRETPAYPSNMSSVCNTGVSEDTRIRQEVSKNFTVAPAYNKGAYQVISKENIKDIGR